MADLGHDRVAEAECAVFCRYLTGRQPPEPVLAQYVRAHARRDTTLEPADPIHDALLLRIARRGAVAASFADSYASLFAKRSVLRRKLILLLAILESTGSTHAWVDSVTTPSRSLFLLRSAAAVGAFAIRALAVAVVVLPLAFSRRLLGRRSTTSSTAP
jgi:hypothetical protein